MSVDLESAARRWADQLVDLTGNNNLLYYRELRVGTLDLTGSPDDVMNRLLRGDTVTLSQLTRSEPGDAPKRLRTIHKKAVENYEERGLQTANLALGLATWDDTTSSSTANAPVLMCPLAVKSLGTNSDEFEVTLDGDWVVNPTLLYKLRNDFGFQVELDAAPDPDGDGFDVADARSVFDEFVTAVRTGSYPIPGFAIADARIVGNFAYTRQPMVDDLANNAEAFAAHDLIRAIAGDLDARQNLLNRHPSFNESAPDQMDPREEFLVLDADSSQHYVINAVAAGADVVVQGPPGTGKSQTIANLIATLAARQRSVLFVAEKRAAIEAVTSRLESVGLGELIMDLHDGVGSRKRIATELTESMEAAERVTLVDRGAEYATLVSHRQRLNDHAAAVNEKRDPWGVSLIEVQTELLAVHPDFGASLRLPAGVVQTLSSDTVNALGKVLREWLDLGGLHVTDTRYNPWAAAYGKLADDDAAYALWAAADSLARQTVPDTAYRMRALLAELGLREPGSLGQWTDLFTLLDDVTMLSADVHPEAYTADLDELIDALAPADTSGTKRFMANLFDKRYKTARRDAAELVVGDLEPADARRRLEAVRTLRIRWSASSVDGGPPRLSQAESDVRARYGALQNEFRSLGAWVGVSQMETAPIDQTQQTLQTLVGARDYVYRMPRLYELEARLHAAGLGDYVATVRSDPTVAGVAPELLRILWCRAVIDEIRVRDPRIGMFHPVDASRRAAEFAEMDRDHVSVGRDRVLGAWAGVVSSVRRVHPDQEQLILKQGARKRSRMSLRDLFDKAPDLMKALKPCWAMSPLVVSQLLPAHPGIFDVVIFDEASQVTPASAIPALFRGRQSVVAGDSKQLPPTSFFSSDNEVSDEDFDEDDATGDMESILDTLATLLPPPKGSRTLSWHYRSQDERLIAFSNMQDSLYRGAMVTFPGVVPEAVRHVLVDGVAGAGNGDSSSSEVERVVDLIREHAEQYPGESLGVIALGIKHAERIEAVVRERARTDRVLEGMLNETGNSRMFIKNLERVQGDERDAIILTIGYSKSADGRMRYMFGPINQTGGERRLNVAITRARRRMTVVSSFSSADMDPSKLRAEGAKMLRRYLQYAESGGNVLSDEGVVDVALNPFENDMLNWMRHHGIPVFPQYGVSGYRIDFALGHPEREGLMVLAVEADGASYHSSPTARDRDRLRQEHLERLGWRFHRVWSTAWFQDRDGEMAKILQAWREAVAASDAS